MRRSLFLLPLLLILMATPAQSAGLVSKGDVRQAGREAAVEIEKEHGLWRNASEQRRLQRIGNHLAREAKYREGTVFAFQILDMEEVNAFSLPDGHIYVTRGLMQLVKKDDDMLAAVLAHEIGHLSELHAFRRVERAMRQQLGLGLLGAIFGDDLGDVGGLAVEIGNVMLLNEYSQDQELRADEYGIVLTRERGYDIHAMERFLGFLAEEEEKVGALKYLRSHPYSATRQRIAAEFREQVVAGQVPIKDYTSPQPPASAFEYDYPNFGRATGNTGRTQNTYDDGSSDSHVGQN